MLLEGKGVCKTNDGLTSSPVKWARGEDNGLLQGGK